MITTKVARVWNPMQIFLVGPNDTAVFYCFHRFFISNLTLSVLWYQYLVYEALPSTAVNETSLSQVNGVLWHRSLSIWIFSHWHKVHHIQKHQLSGGRRGKMSIVFAWLFVNCSFKIKISFRYTISQSCFISRVLKHVFRNLVNFFVILQNPSNISAKI